MLIITNMIKESIIKTLYILNIKYGHKIKNFVISEHCHVYVDTLVYGSDRYIQQYINELNV